MITFYGESGKTHKALLHSMRKVPMNQREKEILKQIMKDNLTIEENVDGEITLYFAGEKVCRTKKDKKVVV